MKSLENLCLIINNRSYDEIKIFQDFINNCPLSTIKKLSIEIKYTSKEDNKQHLQNQPFKNTNEYKGNIITFDENINEKDE